MSDGAGFNTGSILHRSYLFPQFRSVAAMHQGKEFGLLLSIKLSITWLLSRCLHGSLSYLVVQCLSLLASNSIHSRIPFPSTSLVSLKEYFVAAIGFKLLDYLIFSVIFSVFNLTTGLSVVIATFTVASLRMAAANHVLKFRFSAAVAEMIFPRVSVRRQLPFPA